MFVYDSVDNILCNLDKVVSVHVVGNLLRFVYENDAGNNIEFSSKDAAAACLCDIVNAYESVSYKDFVFIIDVSHKVNSGILQDPELPFSSSLEDMVDMCHFLDDPFGLSKFDDFCDDVD